MRAFDYHPLSKSTVKSQLLWGLTFPQSAWIIAGAILSMKWAAFVPPISFLPFPYKYLHYILPLGICAIFGFLRHSTGLSLMEFLFSLRKYKKRKKEYLNHSLR